MSENLANTQVEKDSLHKAIAKCVVSRGRGLPVSSRNFWLYLEPVESSRMLFSKDADLALSC